MEVFAANSSNWILWCRRDFSSHKGKFTVSDFNIKLKIENFFSMPAK